MGRLAVAFRLFFKALGDPTFAERAQAVLFTTTPGGGAGAAGTQSDKRTPAAPARIAAAPAAPVAPVRSDAVTLLSVLQREARLIDFLQEEIAPYEDAQIGAAVRDVHRDARAAIGRLFALRPVIEQAEGADVALPAGLDAARIRLVGNVGAQAPARGRLQHAGWQVTKVDLPQFTGSADAAKIVAPAEVEV